LKSRLDRELICSAGFGNIDTKENYVKMLEAFVDLAEKGEHIMDG